jgi:hypothetical protein
MNSSSSSGHRVRLGTKSCKDFLAELDQALAEHKATYKRLGSILLEAKETLSFSEYQDLETYLMSHGFTRGKIKVCLAAATGEVDESLIFYVEKKERLVRLPAKDQARLLTDRFPLRQEDGSVEEKSWSQMSAAEKFQLVGPQCNRVLPPDQQEVRTKGDRRVSYDQIDLVGDDLVLHVGRRSGKINLANLVLSMTRSGEFPRFLQRIKQLEKTFSSGGKP